MKLILPLILILLTCCESNKTSVSSQWQIQTSINVDEQKAIQLKQQLSNRLLKHGFKNAVISIEGKILTVVSNRDLANQEESKLFNSLFESHTLELQYNPTNEQGEQMAIQAKENRYKYLLLDSNDISSVETNKNEATGRHHISVQLDQDAAVKFGYLSTLIAQEQGYLSIIFDNTLLSHNKVKQPILGGSFQIPNEYEFKEANELKHKIELNNLVFELKKLNDTIINN